MNTIRAAKVNWDELEEGYELPAHTRDITATLVVGGAISATHDYAFVHHDHRAARSAAAEDVFMNILTTNGLIGKYLTDWCGSTGEIKSITLRLAVPNYPGDQMTITGRVTKKYEKENSKLVEIEFIGKNSLGNHASGKAVVAL